MSEKKEGRWINWSQLNRGRPGVCYRCCTYTGLQTIQMPGDDIICTHSLIWANIEPTVDSLCLLECRMIIQELWWCQTQNSCIPFIQRRPNVFDVGLTLYKCHTNVLCLLGGCQLSHSQRAPAWQADSVTTTPGPPRRQHATSRSQRLTTIYNLGEWLGKNHSIFSTHH